MYPTQIQLYHFAKPDTAGLAYLMYMEAQAKKIKKAFDSVVVLKEVVVQSKAKSAIDVLMKNIHPVCFLQEIVMHLMYKTMDTQPVLPMCFSTCKI